MDRFPQDALLSLLLLCLQATQQEFVMEIPLGPKAELMSDAIYRSFKVFFRSIPYHLRRELDPPTPHCTPPSLPASAARNNVATCSCAESSLRCRSSARQRSRIDEKRAKHKNNNIRNLKTNRFRVYKQSCFKNCIA